ncbi:MAG: M23 family metallopeptidase, partial [Thermoleophilia bacterium]|nr:M23 family metallopeptidase [Thermoleophilia bacterium]
MRRLLLAAILAALLLAPIGHAWTWPAGGPVLRPFLFDLAHPFAGGQHRGIAIGGDSGSSVLAPAAGAVTFAGSVPSSGKSVTITTADGYAVTLTHLGSIAVTKGASVAEGDGVGTIGASGDADVPQPYVHLGVRIAAQPQGYLDPLQFLPTRVAAPPSLVPVPAPGDSAPALAPVAVADPPPAPEPPVADAP